MSPIGFEPMTFRLGIECSILLSYEDKRDFKNGDLKDRADSSPTGSNPLQKSPKVIFL